MANTPYHRPRGAPRASSSASACTVAPTSCTRTSAAPRCAAAKALARLPPSRSPTGRCRTWPRKDLRDVPATRGWPRAPSRSSPRQAGPGCAPPSCRTRIPGPGGCAAARCRPCTAAHRAPAQEPVYIVDDVVVRPAPAAWSGAFPACAISTTEASRSATSGAMSGSKRRGADVVHHDGAGVQGGGGDAGAPGVHRHPAPRGAGRSRGSPAPRGRALPPLVWAATPGAKTGRPRPIRSAPSASIASARASACSGSQYRPAVGERVRRDVQKRP